MSRQQPTPSTESHPSLSPQEDSQGGHQGDVSEPPSSSNHPRASDVSEGYPSWLPKRPPPPAPTSTWPSSVGGASMFDTPPSFSGGRKPTPRSVRVVSLQDPAGANRREPTDQTRSSAPLHQRVWSRATSAGLSPTLISAVSQDRPPIPRFRSTGLHTELLRNPSLLLRLYFCLLPIITFIHIPLQTFFDFNAVFILIEVAMHPNPEAPGVPGSGKGWILAAAVYVACWFAWILVFVIYELIYSFYRRWRVKRPLITPIYFSSPAFNLVSIISYTNFCFLHYIRYSAFFGKDGSLRDGLAETFWFYSQNLPSVVLLLPRAGLCLALLFSFSFPDPNEVSLVDAGISGRDTTFFRASNGTLTDYARGVLIANAAWTAWRTLVLLFSWIGLWVLSGHACAGLCGPRYRWEEEDAEKTVSIFTDAASDVDALPWSWKAYTRMRIQEAYEFCLTVKPSTRWGAVKKEKGSLRASQLLAEAAGVGVGETPVLQSMEQVFAAVGLPTMPSPARRGILSEGLFDRPTESPRRGSVTPPELVEVMPKVAKRPSKDKHAASESLRPGRVSPYPFTARGAQLSSEDEMSYPPAGSGKTKAVAADEAEEPSSGQTGDEENEDDEDDEDDDGKEDEEDEEEDGEEEEGEGEEKAEDSEEHARTSGSLSSLGQPLASRYPFQFRHPHRGTSHSPSVGTHSTPQSHATPSTNSRSTQSRFSRVTQSTGNGETSSDSPLSQNFGSNMSSPVSGYGSPIPMPPRHPQPSRGRPRAGTVPSSFPSSPSPVVFPRVGGRVHVRTRTESIATEAFGGIDSSMYDSYMDMEDGDNHENGEMAEEPEPEGEHEAAEEEDSVGLLGSGSRSPHSSLASNRRRQRMGSRSASRSGSNSRTDSRSSSSPRSRSRAGSAVRSRAQSLIQSIGAASRSSVDMVQMTMRSRANSSMARLEEDPPYSSDARSRSGSASDAIQSSNENYTFGHPLRTDWRDRSMANESATIVEDPPGQSAGVIPQSAEGARSQETPSKPRDNSPPTVETRSVGSHHDENNAPDPS